MNNNALENFEKNHKPSAKKSVFLEYIEDIEYLLSKGFSRKQVYGYLQQTYKIVETIDALYKFLKKHNLKPFLKNPIKVEEEIKKEPVKEEIKLKPTAPEPKPQPAEEETQPKPKPQPVKPEEEENPLTYKEYSKDYDSAIEVLNPEQLKKTGFSFRKDAWRKLTKDEFKRAEWMLANKPIAFWQIKKKGVYYKTIRNLKNECIEKGHDLRRYLAYLSSLRNKKDNDPAINSLDFFIKKVMDFGD